MSRNLEKELRSANQEIDLYANDLLPKVRADLAAKEAECARLRKVCVAIRERDFAALLEIAPGGIEHRASQYNAAAMFELEGSYEDDARHSFPARCKMFDAAIDAALAAQPNDTALDEQMNKEKP